VTLRALALVLLLAPSAHARPSLSGARKWALFYGGKLSSTAWARLDLAMLDPDNYQGDPSTGTPALAYVSAGEVDERRAWWAQAQGKDWVVEPNPEWAGAHRVDLRSEEWRKILLDTVIASAAARGYDGVMFDTIDVASYFESSAPARFAGSKDAAAQLILELRRARPDFLIVVNNGLDLLDRIGPAIDGLVVEDVYTRCRGADAESCGPTPEPETAGKEAILSAFAKTGKPVFLPLYSSLAQRDSRWMRKALRRAKAKGFLPYLAAPSLERLGTVAP
jgi:uncharacterized protein (TIGR01370 family)